MWWLSAAFALLLFQAPPDPQKDGIKAIEEQRYGDAVVSLERAIAVNPKDAHSQYYLGYALSMLRRDDESIVAYRKAIELQPDLHPARLNLGLVLLRQKRPAEAIEAVTPAVNADP